MHVDRARAEEELARDLPVRSPDRDQAHDLEFAPGQPATLEVAGGAPAEVPLGMLAESGEVCRKPSRQRSGAQPARCAVRSDEPLHGLFATAGGDECRSGSALRLGALEGCTRVRNQLQRAIELLRRRLRLALEQRDLAERVASADSASACPVSAAIAVSAAAQAWTSRTSCASAKTVAAQRNGEIA